MLLAPVALSQALSASSHGTICPRPSSPRQPVLALVSTSTNVLLPALPLQPLPQGICLLVNFACTFSHTKRERELLMRVAAKSYSSA